MPNILTDLRPKVASEFLTDDPAVINAIKLAEQGQLPTTVLITGASGVGKTTLAKILAGDAQIEDCDIGDMRGIENAREIIDRYRHKPLTGDAVLILDECHAFTKDAQTALLRFTEEPPPWVRHIFLCTTEPGKLQIGRAHV